MVRLIALTLACMTTVVGFATLGCSGARMHTLPPESYRYLQDDRVLLTTRDTVSLRPDTSAGTVEVKVRLNRVGVQSASVLGDSLAFKTGRLAGKASLADIAAVHYYGIFDTSVGLLTNEEIRAYSTTDPGNVGLTAAGIGVAIAYILVEVLNPFESLDEELNKVAPAVAVVLGAGAGYLYGRRVGTAKMEKEAVDHARSLQQETQEQE